MMKLLSNLLGTPTPVVFNIAHPLLKGNKGFCLFKPNSLSKNFFASSTEMDTDVYEKKNYGYRRENPLFLAKPRPTQYNPRIAAAVSDPPTAIRIRIMYYIWGLALVAFIVPCIASLYEVNAYYKQYGHLYKTGWNLYHYDDLKGS